jgi:hypothetical protein
MTAFCRTYRTHSEARDAVAALLRAGVRGEQIRVLMGETPRDRREAPAGAFAGTVDPGAPAGTFGGAPHREDAPAGSFAGAAADAARRGSFADADRETLTTYPGSVAAARIAGHHDVRRILEEAGLDRAAVERDFRALHDGRVLVLVDTAGAGAATVEAALAAVELR